MDGLRLGTRGSPLALAQARKVAAAIETAQRWPDGYVELVTITTTGDTVLDRPLAEIGGKGLWTKELDKALLAGELSFCVHSMKDVESVRPKTIHIAAVRPRGDVRDRLIGAESIDALKKGAVVIRFKVLPNGRLMEGSMALEGRSGDTGWSRRCAWPRARR